MTRRSGTADLPLHGGRVPAWLGKRMAALGAAVVEALVEHHGRGEVLTRLSDPHWFQAFGCLLGMDWHSSGITTSVVGALKRGLAERADHLGLRVCGGRGAHSRKTPAELLEVGDKTGLDGEALGRVSRLVAKVDNNAVQDGFQLYLHAFVVADDGEWIVIQQGMNPADRTARRYHWRSAGVRSFVEEPHQAIFGHSVGQILNLTDRRSRPARDDTLELTRLPPASVVRELTDLRHLALPRHHAVRPSDVLIRRLHATLEVARDRAPEEFADLLLLPGLGPRSLAALALLAEVLHGHPARFADPARFAFAHGGKDGHPHPVLTSVYDQTIASLTDALVKARLGDRDRLEAIERLDRHRRWVEAEAKKVERLLADGRALPGVAELSDQGWRDAPALGGKTAAGPVRAPAQPQLALPLGDAPDPD